MVPNACDEFLNAVLPLDEPLTFGRIERVSDEIRVFFAAHRASWAQRENFARTIQREVLDSHPWEVKRFERLVARLGCPLPRAPKILNFRGRSSSTRTES